MSDTAVESALTGTIVAIAVGRYGVDLSLVPQGSKPSAQSPIWGNLTCRLDSSSVHLPLMLELAKTAMLAGLLVYASGIADNRDPEFVADQLRIFKDTEN